MSRVLPRAWALALLSAVLFAQSADAPKFSSAMNLVLVPFNVERGKYFAADLQSSDFTLREDGHPREFTIFEGPNTAHPLPLELDLLFDTSVVPKKVKQGLIVSDWNAKDTYEFLNNWDESITQEILHQNGMDVRLVVYHYSANQWERLCGATSDPREIVGAFQRLLNPIPPGTGELTILAGSTVSKSGILMTTGWLQEATAATLKDAASTSAPARRILLLFSNGYVGTGGPLQLGRIAEQSTAEGIRIDPIMLDLYKQQNHPVAVRISGGGPASGISLPIYHADGSVVYVDAPITANLGQMTGGEPFVPERLDRNGLASILQSVRNKMLSEYVVGFAPGPSEKPRKHRLDVVLKPKDKGKLVGGERSGVVY